MPAASGALRAGDQGGRDRQRRRQRHARAARHASASIPTRPTRWRSPRRCARRRIVLARRAPDAADAEVLIANRGEIACRIIRSCRALGSAHGRGLFRGRRERRCMSALADRPADRPGAGRQSYLASTASSTRRATSRRRRGPSRLRLPRRERGLRRAVRGGRPDLDRPDAANDRRHGRQGARARAGRGRRRAGPAGQSALRAAAISRASTRRPREVGYPLLVKAAAGGGGIGMRRVDGPERAREDVSRRRRRWPRARSATARSISNATSRKARHIEIQVFGFGDGRAVHLLRARMLDPAALPEDHRGEARRPASPTRRASAMAEAAVALARAGALPRRRHDRVRASMPTAATTISSR